MHAESEEEKPSLRRLQISRSHERLAAEIIYLIKGGEIKHGICPFEPEPEQILAKPADITNKWQGHLARNIQFLQSLPQDINSNTC